jgi:hypothetical protein
MPLSKKPLGIVFALALLFSAVTGTKLVNLARANPMNIEPLYCSISIQSPQNRTYDTEPVLLNFTVKTNYELGAYQYFYFLDGQDTQASVKVEEIQDFGPSAEYHHEGQIVLPTVSDGWHNLTVFLGYVDADGVIHNADVDPFSATAHFNVDAASQQEPFPATWLIAAIATIAVGGAAFTLYYFTKNRKTTLKTEKSQPREPAGTRRLAIRITKFIQPASWRSSMSYR